MFWEKLSLHDNKSIDLPTFRLVTATTFLREKPSKISSHSISKVESRVQRSLLLLLLDQFMIRCTKTFSCLPTIENLNLCQKISSGLLRKKNPDFSSFLRNDYWNKLFHATLNSRPTSLFIAGFLQLIRSASLTFLLCHRRSKPEEIVWQRFKFRLSASRKKFFVHRIINWSSKSNKSDRWTLDSTLEIERRFLKVFPWGRWSQLPTETSEDLSICCRAVKVFLLLLLLLLLLFCSCSVTQNCNMNTDVKKNSSSSSSLFFIYSTTPDRGKGNTVCFSEVSRKTKPITVFLILMHSSTLLVY